MKLGSATVLTLSLVFAFSSLAAQDASVASASDVNQCVRWMKATVSARVPDPTEFCSGIWDGQLGGWYSVFECGEPTQQPTGRAPRYCASSGQISAGEAWGAGFRSATKYGSELFGGNPEQRKNRNRPTLRFTAEQQCGWEASGCQQECTTLFPPSRRMGGVLVLPSRTEIGMTPVLRSNIWEVFR